MKTFYAPDRKTWQDWLEKNHDKEPEIWLIKYHKSSKIPSVSYEDSVEEALCFGWIDSLHRSRDKESSIQKFGPRRPNGNWAESNRIRAKRLIAEGLMTEAGRKVLPADL
ncbi:hypothetical protein E6Q11_00600 [Candidatus Dojkabacteria bacterium]|uniref:Bacteriocin-protection protein n=1 Tax=Candidatus Dojkabacteria bacterium TaxID=2099670 RepID=A0A5C7JB24_9BACT|nr:MAG: hypothetical protein E6Q11_00600 [Candidatus Dojkabacteria bacterium]